MLQQPLPAVLILLTAQINCKGQMKNFWWEFALIIRAGMCWAKVCLSVLQIIRLIVIKSVLGVLSYSLSPNLKSSLSREIEANPLKVLVQHSRHETSIWFVWNKLTCCTRKARVFPTVLKGGESRSCYCSLRFTKNELEMVERPLQLLVLQPLPLKHPFSEINSQERKVLREKKSEKPKTAAETGDWSKEKNR